jgi:dihydroorotate dehydrogenase
VAHSDSDVYDRLEIIANKFLRERIRNLPVIVKFSNDILPDQLELLLEHLIKLRFDGITLGNTSINYAQYANLPRSNDKKLYDYFTKEFGGGISGNILKRNSLQLCETATKYVRKINPNHEFNVIRSGGIDCIEDLFLSEQAGVALNQWYSGYFSNYLKYGDDIYKEMYHASN